MSFKIATMCSGIGSPEQSLRELGIPHENVFACEKDKFARQTYLANFNPGIMSEDMTTETWDLPEQYADLIVAGIPCQSFSLAGKRQGENDPRGLLIYDFIRYVKSQRPKVFIIENVKGLLSDAGGVTFSKWLDLLGCSRNNQPNMFTNVDGCGYNLHYRVLNCKHYGLPQNRERIFIIGIRSDISAAFTWPRKVVLRDRLIDLLEPVVDEKYYLSDEFLKYINENSERTRVIDSSFPVSLSILANQAKTGTDSVLIKEVPSKESGGVQPYQQNRVYDCDGLSPAIDGKAGIYGIAMRGRNPDNPKSRKSGEHTEQMIEINENPDISNVVTSVQKDNLILDNYRIRRLTPLECMRLMGYPDEFVKPVSETQTYKQAGNSIPVHMMKAILKQLLPILTA